MSDPSEEVAKHEPRADLGTVSVNTLAAALGIAGSLLAAWGRTGEHLSAGLLGPREMLLTVNWRAFWIWWPITAGLLAFIGWLWWPGNRGSQRLQTVAWPGLTAGATHFLTTVFAGQGLVLAGCVTLVVEIGALCLLVWRLVRHRSSGILENLATDIGWGLLLGFASVQALIMVSVIVETFELADGRLYLIIAMLACGVLLVGGWGMAGRLYRQFSVGAALVWGFCWLGLERFSGEPRNLLLGGMALICALLIPIAFVASGMRKRDDVPGLGRAW